MQYHKSPSCTSSKVGLASSKRAAFREKNAGERICDVKRCRFFEVIGGAYLGGEHDSANPKKRLVISMRSDVRIVGLRGFPLVKPGDDIARLAVERARSLGIRIANGDIFVIGHKIISKSEGRIVTLSGVEPSRRAVDIARRCGKDPRLVQLILKESRRLIKVSAGILLVQTRRGIVCLNAGIDKSNVEGRDAYCLLPKNPELSATRIAKRILERTGKRVQVVVTDTHSRPFRSGQTEFAIGATGLDPFVDYRGTEDLFGNVLRFKRVSVADELASAGELVMGQGAEGIPIAIIRGVNRIRARSHTAGSRLEMKKGRDLFRGAL